MKNLHNNLFVVLLFCFWHVLCPMEMQLNNSSEIAVARAQSLLELGKTHVANNDDEKAKKCFAEVLKQDIDKVSTAMAWQELATIHNKRYLEARNFFEQAPPQDPNSGIQANTSLVLGKMYYYGTGEEKDYEKARVYLEKAAQQCVNIRVQAEANNLLGNIYYYGYGREKDYQKALKCFEQAAYQDENIDAQAQASLMLGEIHSDCWQMLYPSYLEKKTWSEKEDWLRNNHRIIEKHREQSLEHYEQAAGQDANIDAQAQASLKVGSMYYSSQATEAEYLKVREYWEKASNQTHNLDCQTCARFNLGQLYFLGHGVEVNYQKAREYYEHVGAQNLDIALQANAWLLLGDMYYKGQGVAVDYQKAREYYKKALRQNAHTGVQGMARDRLKQL